MGPSHLYACLGSRYKGLFYSCYHDDLSTHGNKSSQFVLSLGAVIALFLGVLFFQETIFAFHASRNARFYFLLSFFGINLTFTPMHFLGFNLQPRRIPDFPDNFNSWNFLSSIGSGLTLFAFLGIRKLTENSKDYSLWHLPRS